MSDGAVGAAQPEGWAPLLRAEGRSMASPLRFSAVEVDRSRFGAAWRSITAEFAASDASMSRFRDDSEVTAANRASIAGTPFAPTRRLAVALHATDRAHRLTGRRFDPRTLTVLERWGYRGSPLGSGRAGNGGLGSAAPIVERLDRQRMRLPHPVDLGGIGKGLALRWAAERVETTGVSRFLIDAGGDMVARGPGPEGGIWLVGVEDPRGGDEPRAVIALSSGAVATSSVRNLRWVTNDGLRVHHLVDPVRAAPADGGLAAVTVVAGDPAWAEVWSKALFLAGRRDIAVEARSRGLAAWWIDVDGTLEMTPAARQGTIWVPAGS